MEAQTRRNYQRPKPNYRSQYARRGTPAESPQASIAETIVFQCIICIIILSVVFFVTIMHVPFAQELRQNIKYAISGDIDFNNLSNFSFGLDNSMGEVKETVKNIFEGEQEKEEGETVNVFAPDVTEVPSQTLPSQFRIDEDILSEINAMEDYYTTEEEKKPLVPLEDTQVELQQGIAE